LPDYDETGLNDIFYKLDKNTINNIKTL